MYYYGYVVYKVAWAQQVIVKHILEIAELSQSDIDEFLEAIRRKISLSMEICIRDCYNISTKENPKFVVSKRFIRYINNEYIGYLKDYLDARRINIDKKALKKSIKLLNQYSKDQFINFSTGRLTKANVMKLRREI